jgi:hypothetical protein
MRVAKWTSLSARLTRALAAVAAMFVLPVALTSCTSSNAANGAARNASTIALNNISALKSLFNRDDGHTRLILIFSPT